MENDTPRNRHERRAARTGIDDTQNTFTSNEAAFYIGMSEQWLRQCRCLGNPEQPPYMRIGRSIRYLRADLDAWLASRRHAA